MKTANSVTRRVITALLCLSLLCGMVVGTIGTPAVASTETVKTFTADFAKLATEAVTAENYGDGTLYTPVEGDAANQWVSNLFDMYYNRENRGGVREHLGQSSVDVEAAYGETYDDSSRVHTWMTDKDGYLRHNVTTKGGEMLRKGDALIVKNNGETATLQNFEATLVFNTEENDLGAVYIAFREQDPGKFGWSTSTKTSLAQDAVILGNGNGWNAASAAGYDGVVVKKSGEAPSCGNNTILEEDRFAEKLAANTDYELYIKAIGTTLTVKLRAVGSETYIYDETTTDEISNTVGSISIGTTNSTRSFKSFAVTELNEWGEAVDFGTYATPSATEDLSIDFAELAAKVTSTQWGSNAYYETTSTDTDLNTWVSDRFSMYISQEGNTFAEREYLGQTDSDKDGASWNVRSRWRIKNDGYLQHFATGDGMLRKVNTLTLQRNGEAAELQNFEAELTFKFDLLATSNQSTGAVLLTFHETGTPGKFDFNSSSADSPDAVIVGSGEYSADSGTTVTYPAGIRIKKNGEALNNDRYLGTTRYPDKEVSGLTANVNYTLYVKVVNGDLTVGILNADTGATVYAKTTFEDAVSDIAGSLSIGGSNYTSPHLKSIKVVELDENGDAVDFGTMSDRYINAVSHFEADFADLAAVVTTEQWNGGTTYQSASADDTAINEWVNARFGLYHSREGHTFAARTYLGETACDTDAYHGQSYYLINSSGYLQHVCSGDGMLRKTNSLYLKQDGAAMQFTNFEATLTFKFSSVTALGAVHIAFHENEGYEGVADWHEHHNGNDNNDIDEPDAVILGYGADKTGDTAVNRMGLRIRKKGSDIPFDSGVYPDIDVAGLAANVDYNLHVKVVGTDLTVGITDANTGTVVMADTLYEDAVSGDTGAMSFGVSNTTHSLKKFEVVALDDSGDVLVSTPEQADNTAVVDGNAITVKAGEGYQLKAGSLIVTDANGNTFVPERVGYRNGGNASRYTIPADAVAPYTVAAEFYQPGDETGYNMGLIGTSVHTEDSGLRFIHRLNIDKDGNMLYNGENVAIKEYGLLLASGAVLKNAEDLDIETADESAHVHQFAWPETNKYYDVCDDHVDIAIHVKNIATYNGQDTDIITRTYIILEDDTVVYGDVAVSTYNEALA